MLVTTFLINHFDLFGLRQVWRICTGRPQQALKFVTPVLYRIVRHPLYVGWFFAFWCTPTMTVTHLLFAVMTTAYILIAIQLEERDLIARIPSTPSTAPRADADSVPAPQARRCARHGRGAATLAADASGGSRRLGGASRRAVWRAAGTPAASQPMRSAPMYGRRASGMTTEPSACW